MTDRTPELSAADVAWLTALARSLTSSWPDADDLVQETWMAARNSPPRDGEVRRQWMTRVLQRFHLRALRTDRRRVRREGEASHSEAVPSTSELVERAELHKKLTECMIGLEEPYRTALMLVVLEGFTTADLAEHEDISQVNARRRVRKAREQMRQKLQRDYGQDWDHWHALLVPLALKPLPGEVGPWQPELQTAGSSSASASIWTVAGLPLVAAVTATVGVAGLWTALVWNQPSEVNVEPQGLLAQGEAASATREVAEPPSLVRTEGSGREPLMANAATGPEPTADLQSPHEPSATVILRGHLRARDPHGGQWFTQSGEFFLANPEGRVGVRLERGSFEIELPANESWLLVRNAHVNGRAAIFDGPRQIGPFTQDAFLDMEVTLLPPSELVVVDADTGQPLSGLTVVEDPTGRARHEQTFPHPLEFGAEHIVSKGDSSPLTISPRSAYQNVYFVRCEGYGWGTVRLDHLRGGTRTLTLTRGEAELAVHVSGAPDRDVSLFATSPRGGRARFELGASGSRSLTLEHLALESLDLKAVTAFNRSAAASVDLVEGFNEMRLELPEMPNTATSTPVNVQATVTLAPGWEGLAPRLRFRGPTRLTATEGRRLGEPSELAWAFPVELSPGEYLVEVEPTGWSQLVRVGDSQEALHVEVPSPTVQSFALVDADTGERLDASEFGAGVRWSRGPDAPFQSTTSVPYRAERSRWELRVAPVPLSLRVSGGDYVPRSIELPIQSASGEHLIALRPFSGLILELRDDGIEVVTELDWVLGLELIPLEGNRGAIYTHAFDGVDMVHRVSGSGRFRLKIPEVPGYQAAEPIELTLAPGEPTRVQVDLDPLP